MLQGADLDVGALFLLDRPLVVGWSPECRSPLRDEGVSRLHAEVTPARQGTGELQYLLRDLGSTNGTMVNGTKLSGPRPLAEGDNIFLGATVLRFAMADSLDARYHAKVDGLLSVDDLTDLVAKRRFDVAFAEAVQLHVRGRAPLAVLVMDLDGVQAINDSHGHYMGAFAIAEAGKPIAVELGSHGPATRFGGDKFVACLPGLDRAVACHTAERLRLRVAHHRFEKDGIVVAPTISIGVATLPECGDSPEALFRAADRALYRAERAGNNRVSE